MPLACHRCGTEDFAVEGKTFPLTLMSPDCRLVMCPACAGRAPPDTLGIEFICCYQRRSIDLRDAAIWAERLLPEV